MRVASFRGEIQGFFQALERLKCCRAVALHFEERKSKRQHKSEKGK